MGICLFFFNLFLRWYFLLFIVGKWKMSSVMDVNTSKLMLGYNYRYVSLNDGDTFWEIRR